MKGTMMNLKTGEVFHTAAMAISRLEKSTYGISRSAAETCDRFSHAAKVLPQGECLGWQFAAVPGGKPRVTVFSSAGVTVTSEDFDWIFQDCARAGEIRQESLGNLREDGCRVYALRAAAGADERNGGGNADLCSGRFLLLDDYDEADPPSGNYEKALDALIRAGAVLRFVSAPDGNGQGMILLSLPVEMSLRLRTMLALAFEGTAAVEVTEAADVAPLPAAFMLQSMTGALCALLWDNAEERREEADLDENTPETEIEDDAMGAGDAIGDDAPIEKLGLGARACNSLKSAGIDTVEKLRALTGDELRAIRNLGRACVSEIEEKLSELSALPAPAPLTAPSYADMLAELVGLQNVKEQIRKIAAFAKMKQDLSASGMDQIPVVLNMEFVGNPGTAKTSVARILAGMFHEMGLLAANELIEVGRADLVARYEGQTADKVKTVFRKAKGKVLFIDEAYSLVENWEGEFGDEAIDTIVQEMENNREDTVVIFAGYPEEMAEFFARNPGLRSRVPFSIRFGDYTPEEMLQIARLEAKKRGFAIHPNGEEKLAAVFAEAAEEPAMGNGRFCRNVIEKAVLEYAARVYGGSEPAGHDFVLAPEDFTPPAKNGAKRIAIGFRA